MSWDEKNGTGYCFFIKKLPVPLDKNEMIMYEI
jgi:hypothetical protein